MFGVRSARRLTAGNIRTAGLPRFLIVPYVDRWTGRFFYTESVDGLVVIDCGANHRATLKQFMGYAHAFEAGWAIWIFCKNRVLDREYECVPLPAGVLRMRLPWTEGVLLQKIRPILSGLFPDCDSGLFWGGAGVESAGLVLEFLPYLHLSLRRPNVLRAWSYLLQSMRALQVDRCDWRREARFDEEWNPPITVGDKETAFHSAYKAIEAVIGDPGGSKGRAERIHRGLANVGCDPSKLIGYRVQRPLCSRVEEMLTVRDKVAAHGAGSKKRDITVAEIIVAQTVARDVVLAAAR